ncbi:glucans biosynthesis protein D [Escherichia coli]|uniref:Glucans biosynthesis protein D n=1 Tax=Escherichia coli TaxID=562 RepID=A0A376RKH5_ECOLX|nr:glucans biosynthesis protein D [Escherichia coli]
MEIPTTGETLDNIVCFWQPEKAVKAGDEFAFQYRLYWSAQPPVHCPLARVMATRTGMGGFPEGWAPGEHYPEKWARRFAVDFVGGDLKAAAPKGIEPVITLPVGKRSKSKFSILNPLMVIVFSLTGIRLRTPLIRSICGCICVVRATLSVKHGCISISRQRRINVSMLTTA